MQEIRDNATVEQLAKRVSHVQEIDTVLCVSVQELVKIADYYPSGRKQFGVG